MIYTYKECIEKYKTNYEIRKLLASGGLKRVSRGVYSDEAIECFIEKINCLEGVVIKRVGKIDLGVHKHMEIEQEEYCFDIAFDDE